MKHTLSILTILLTCVFTTSCGNSYHIEHTLRYQIPVHINAGVAEDRATIMSWIDMRADEWIARKAAWGCEGFSDELLRAMLRREPVVVFPGVTLPCDVAMGRNELNVEIQVTINNPPLIAYSDLMNGIGIGVQPFDYSYGLRQLPHEWTHTARGAWHP